MPVAVRASETISLGFLKKGLVTGMAAVHVGELRLATIQIPRTIAVEKTEALLYGAEDAARLPPRASSGHKGLYGHVFVWAGLPEKQGAAILSCTASLRAGAGLVTLIGEKTSIEEARSRLPVEVMTAFYEDGFSPPKSHDVLALGPGMGVEAASWKILEKALDSEFPLVLDADATTLLSLHSAKAKRRLRDRHAAGRTRS